MSYDCYSLISEVVDQKMEKEKRKKNVTGKLGV